VGFIYTASPCGHVAFKFLAIQHINKNWRIPRFDRGADGELKLASFFVVGTDSAPERLGGVHLHAFGVRLRCVYIFGYSTH